MYKVYEPASEQRPGKASAATSTYWTSLWAGRSFSTKKQVAKLRNTIRWLEIHSRVAKGVRILEAGCGPGTWVRFLDQQGFRVIGLDYSVWIIQRLQRGFPHLSWIPGDVRQLPFRSESFDAVVSWGVIEHLEEGPEQALMEYYRVLRRGGYVFVTVPYLSRLRLLSGYSLTGNNLGQLASPDVVFHQYFMSKDELREFAARAGFEVVTIKYIVE